MKALLSKSAGGPETLSLEDCPDPTALPHQLLIAVQAVGVNYPDVLIIEDRYQFRPPRPFAPGCELAGIVRAVGSASSGFSVGDHVIAISGWGAMAELIAVDAEKCIPLPADVPFATAAALMMTYGTAWYALEQRAQLRAGETLLVLGAAGGVGSATVELGKIMGARVIAAASSEEKLDIAIRRGASAGIIYPRGPLDSKAQRGFADRIKQTCERGVDVICDNVGGSYAEPAMRSMAWNGRYLVVGFTAGVPKIALNLPLLKGCQIVGVFWGQWARLDAAGFRAAGEKLVAMLGSGRIDPLISRRLPLASGAAAIGALADRSSTGKIVLTV